MRKEARKQFCIHGDNILVTGRNKSGQCIECHNTSRRIDPTKDSRLKQFCLREHDTFVVGRDKDGRCSECRRYSSINSKLATNLRNRINRALERNSKVGSAVKDLGCSIEFLKQHLESKFLLEMSWSNWGKGKGKWHIDHILPLDSFDLTDLGQFKQAVHYTNLQPMWQLDNLSKGSKILK